MRGRLSGPVRIRGADVVEAAEPRLIGPAQRLSTGKVQGTDRVAVVAPPTGEDHSPVRLAASEVVRPHKLQAALDRLRAAADRIDGRIDDGQIAAHRPRIRLERLGGEGRAVDVREGPGLALHRVHDRLPAVAHVDHDRTARGVEIGAPVGVPDGAALGAHRHGEIPVDDPLEDSSSDGPAGCPPDNCAISSAHGAIVG